jgi:hypothetical protein
MMRGLALYESLVETGDDFHLYIFAFDDTCYNTLVKMELKHATIISLGEFEDDDLLNVKSKRSRVEYMWTCTPSIVRYCLDRFSLSMCTYVDADLYFFSPPRPLFEELSDSSVLITEHRYTRKYDQTEKAGRFCVQFITFKNNFQGRTVLDWWRSACLDWCYARQEDGKFGDQKYLDDWEERFEGVRVLEHLGGGVAPWNVQQYRVSRTGGKLTGIAGTSSEPFDIIFYHFHDLRFPEDGWVDLGGYRLSREVRKFLYGPYVRKLARIKGNLGVSLPVDHAQKVETKSWYMLYKFFQKRLMSNIIPEKDLLLMD